MNYAVLPKTQAIAHTIRALQKNNFDAELVKNAEAALARVSSLIPKGAKVMNGSSRTLEEIGFMEYFLSGDHGWKNLRLDIVAENDFKKRAALRKEATLCDYFLSSASAITHSGQIVIASMTGSQMPSIAYSSPAVILVAGVNKIVPDLESALERVREYATPREDKRMKALGHEGTLLSKILIIENEPKSSERKIKIFLIKDILGA